MLNRRHAKAPHDPPEGLITTREEFEDRYLETPNVGRPALAKHQSLLLEEYIRREGMQSPQVQIAMDELAGGLERVDLVEQAVTIRREIVTFLRPLLGDEDVAVVGHMENLAHDLHWLEQYDEANVLLERVWEARCRALGARHPLTLETQRDLATSLTRAQQFDRAIALDRDLYSYFQEDNGDQDERTIDAKEQLDSAKQLFEDHGPCGS